MDWAGLAADGVRGGRRKGKPERGGNRTESNFFACSKKLVSKLNQRGERGKSRPSVVATRDFWWLDRVRTDVGSGRRSRLASRGGWRRQTAACGGSWWDWDVRDHSLTMALHNVHLTRSNRLINQLPGKGTRKAEQFRLTNLSVITKD